MSKRVAIGYYGTPMMVVTLGEPDERPELGYRYGSCSIESNLQRETCPVCGQPDCLFCEEAVSTQSKQQDPDDILGRIAYNGGVDAIEAMTLACAAAGIDVGSSAFLEAVDTALQALGNNT